jgi:pyruvate kinase
MVKTGIICTIGPASSNRTVLRKMMLAGMDVARLNFSHGSHSEHGKCIRTIKELNKKYRRKIRILQDLEGYRIRVGKLKSTQGIILKKKQKVLLVNRETKGMGNVIPFDYHGVLTDIEPGNFIYIEDGSIVLKVKSSAARKLIAEVVVPGTVKEHKGINIPDVKLRFRGFTAKDRVDIEFGIRNKVDYIAQSFVRNEKDIMAVKEITKARHPSCKIIAKIENREGIRNIDGILDTADGIMIARGDMGVSIPIYEIAVVQKKIIKKCIRKKKFVITATQMLESMTENVRPTRAEVTDISNAVIDGATMVMLSSETAVGRYPVESVKMMNQIIKYTEEHS